MSEQLARAISKITHGHQAGEIIAALLANLAASLSYSAQSRDQLPSFAMAVHDGLLREMQLNFDKAQELRAEYDPRPASPPHRSQG